MSPPSQSRRRGSSSAIPASNSTTEVLIPIPARIGTRVRTTFGAAQIPAKTTAMTTTSAIPAV